MKTTGVLDRITDDKFATIIVEEMGKDFVIAKKDLPNGAQEGTWFNLVIQKGSIQHIEINSHKTDIKKQKSRANTAKLKNKQSSHLKRKNFRSKGDC